MALWQNQLADRADTTKNPQFQNIQNMVYAGRMDPETALGYTIGRFLSSRYDRWMKNKADDEYETLQKDIKNNTLTTPDGNVLDRNLMYGNQFNNPAIQGGTSAGTTAIDSSMANAAGIGASNQLLGNGLGNGTAQETAQQMADTTQTPAATTTNDGSNGLLTGLEGAKSMVNLGQGKADLGDFLNLSKMLTFFDPAATGENGTAASEESTERNKGPQYVAGSNIPGMIEAGNIDIANRPVVRNPDGSISTVRSITVEADGKYVVLPTIDPQGNNLTPDQAWDRFVRTHENLGVFDSQQAADNYAQSLHTQQEQMYVPNRTASNAGEDLSFLGRGVDIRDLAGTAMEGLQTESAPLDQQGRDFAAALIQAKQAYDIGKSQNNQQVMQTAAETANRIRNVAGQLGIDLTPYDSGRTLAQAQDAFMVDTNKGIQNILHNDMTSDEYYEKLFSDLRHNGMSREQAQRIAAREAGQYQAQRLTRLNDALVQYGVDPLNHTINDYGVMILMRAQQEDPNAASGLARMYGLPADLASEVVQMNLANNNAANSLNNAMTLNGQRFELGKEEAEFEENLKAEEEKRKQAAEDAQKMAIVSRLEQSGVDRNTAIQMVYGGRPWGNVTGVSRGKNGSDTRYNQLKDWLTRYESLHKNDLDDSWKNDPDYRARLEAFNSYTTPEEVPELQHPNNYNEAMSWVTSLIEANAKRPGNRMSKEQIHGVIRNNVDPGIVDAVIADSDSYLDEVM